MVVVGSAAIMTRGMLSLCESPWPVWGAPVTTCTRQVALLIAHTREYVYERVRALQHLKSSARVSLLLSFDEQHPADSLSPSLLPQTPAVKSLDGQQNVPLAASHTSAMLCPSLFTSLVRVHDPTLSVAEVSVATPRQEDKKCVSAVCCPNIKGGTRTQMAR